VIITKHFGFIHIPKTGGTFITHLCREHLPREWILYDPPKVHSRYDEVPPDFAELPMLCFVRNPWDWYVSWYHFVLERRREKQGLLWSSFFGSGRNDFKQTIRNACTMRNFDSEPEGSPNSEPKWASAMRDLDVDYYTAIHWLSAGIGVEPGGVEVGRFEKLREDFLAFLERHKVPIDQAFREAVRDTPPVRPPLGPRQSSELAGKHPSAGQQRSRSSRGKTREHAAYEEYYDEELRELVASQCRLIERYGYSFGS
jgi:hypothetical protein